MSSYWSSQLGGAGTGAVGALGGFGLVAFGFEAGDFVEDVEGLDDKAVAWVTSFEGGEYAREERWASFGGGESEEEAGDAERLAGMIRGVLVRERRTRLGGLVAVA
jgi:hypothetical protein